MFSDPIHFVIDSLFTAVSGILTVKIPIDNFSFLLSMFSHWLYNIEIHTQPIVVCREKKRKQFTIDN